MQSPSEGDEESATSRLLHTNHFADDGVSVLTWLGEGSNRLTVAKRTEASISASSVVQLPTNSLLGEHLLCNNWGKVHTR